ncbi:MAG: class I SAM-dependent DNA methyltransferase [Fusobacteriaceae bacterium]
MYKNFSKVYDYFMEHCDYTQWTDQIYSIFKKYNKESGNLLDIGCGTGEMGLRLTEKYRYSGLDLSEEMLRLANKKLKKLDIQLYQADMVNFVMPERFDVAVALFDTVNHLTSNDELTSHLICMRETLKDDGVYIFDLIDREFMNMMFPGGTFVDLRNKISVIWEHELEEGIDYIDATYFIKNKAGAYDKFTEGYEKKIFTQEEVELSLKKSGMKLLEIIENKEIAGKRYFYVVAPDEMAK